MSKADFKQILEDVLKHVKKRYIQDNAPCTHHNLSKIEEGQIPKHDLGEYLIDLHNRLER